MSPPGIEMLKKLFLRLKVESSSQGPDRAKSAVIIFVCNVCGAVCECESEHALNRENPSCPCCGSNVRFRSLVLALSEVLFGIPLTLAEFPIRKDIKGIGLSDWDPLAMRLFDRFDYMNTYYHQEPQLDITEIPNIHHDKYDFVISSDVFEHVCPPVQRAFNGAALLLKTDGVFVLTVPYHMGDQTEEHFPELFEWSISDLNGSPVLINHTKDGREQLYSNLVFHGGPGQTVEMRLFGKGALVRHMEEAGFTDIRFWNYPVRVFGVCWQVPHSVLITARRSIYPLN